MKRSPRQSHYLLFGLLCIGLYCLPYLVLGPQSYINPLDYLDLTIAHFKNIVNNRLFFSFHGELPLMAGIDRMGIPFVSPFELKGLLFYLFPGYWGVFGNLVIVKAGAFLGMYLLLENYITDRAKGLSFIVALLFALIPFAIDYSLSSAGIPLLLYALLNLFHKEHIPLSYGMVLLYALNSSLSLSGLFVCLILFAAIILLYIKERKVEWRLFGALSMLAVVYLLNNWPLISGFFIPTEHLSHRVEMQNTDSFMDLVRTFFSYLANGQHHAGSFWAAPIVMLVLAVTLVLGKKEGCLRRYAGYYLMLAALIFAGLLAKKIPFQLFASFQFDRFYFLYPSLCFILLAKSCETLRRYTTGSVWVAGALLLALVCVAKPNNEYKVNLMKVAGMETPGKVSYRAFYDEPLFTQLSETLALPRDYSVHVASVGLYPAVAEYNGFHCLDGYVTTYPLRYKQQFRRVIAAELEKNDELREYFDHWGNRCYVFSSELFDRKDRFMCGKQDPVAVRELDLDTSVLKDMGCQYILSAVDILDYRAIGLDYIDSFTTDASYWCIRVYKVL
ncbi:MAG: DUF6044 family protein [Bacteroidales bacterium]|nr:DUF6044 family protein [Bacteroidales bacterium]